MPGYLTVAGVAAVVTFLATFVVRRVAPRIGAIAMPGPRSVHVVPTPSLGGAGMFVGFLIAMAVASQLGQFREVFTGNTEPLGLLLAAAVMFVVGAIDDLRDVSPPAKIAGQVLSGSVLSLLGVTMLYFRLPFASYDYVVLSADLAPLVTVLTVVILANAINLIDGLDGLACGIVLIASAAIFLYADRLFKAGLLEGSNMAPLVAAVTVGICLGFLPHNFNPARVFMGDSGSMLIGLLLASATITITGQVDPATVSQMDLVPAFFPLVLPLAVLALPLVDLLLAIARRTRAGRMPWHPDKMHLHHRLLALGHSHARAVLIMYIWTAIAAYGVASAKFVTPAQAVVGGLVAVAIASGLTFGPLRARRNGHRHAP